MLLVLYALYLLRWYFIMRDKTTELPQIIDDLNRLRRYALLIGKMLAVTLLLDTGCRGLIEGTAAIEEVGFNAMCRVWHDLIYAMLWVLIIA